MMRKKEKCMALLLSLCILCIAVSTGIPIAAEEGDITTGLAAHYDFEGVSGSTVKDTTGNGNDAKLVGGKTAAGKLDGAIYLDSTKGAAYSETYADDAEVSRLEIPVSALAATGDVTIALLLKSDSDLENAALMSFGDMNNSNDDNARFMYLWLCHYAAGAGAHAAIQAPGAARNHIKADMDDFVKDDNNWHWYVFTLSGEDVTLFIDGYVVAEGESKSDLGSLLQTELINEQTGAGNHIISLGTSAIFAADDSFAGWVDDVRIYNRALSGTDIKALTELGGSTGTESPDKTEAPAQTPAETRSPAETTASSPAATAEKPTGTTAQSTANVTQGPDTGTDTEGGFPWAIVVIAVLIAAAAGGTAYYFLAVKKKKQ